MLLERSSATSLKAACCPFGRRLLLIQGIDDAYHLGRRGVLQWHDLHVRIAHLIDALDDAHDAVHVIGAIGDYENVRGRIGGEVAVLRNERRRRIGTSCAAFTLFTAITCVTISSELELTWSGRSFDGY